MDRDPARPPPAPETVPTEEVALVVPLTGDMLIVIFATVWIFLLGFVGGEGAFLSGKPLGSRTHLRGFGFWICISL